jgi:hypothetical protein
MEINIYIVVCHYIPFYDKYQSGKYFLKEYENYFMSGLDILKEYGFQESKILKPFISVSSHSTIPDRLFYRNSKNQMFKVKSNIINDVISDHFALEHKIIIE